MYRLLLAVWAGARLLSAVPQVEDVLAQKAVEAERRGDFAGAVSAFRALLRNGADSPELRNNLGIAYFQLRDFRDALQQFQVALTKVPDSVPANLFSGLSLLNLQRAKESLPYLQKARRAQPHDPTTLLALARAEVASNNLSQSRGLYQEVVRIDPQDAEAWYGLGITDRVLAEQALKSSKGTGGATEAAQKARALADASEQAMSRAMQIDPGSVRARMVLGESFRIAERYDLAVKEYKAATEQQPDLAPAWAGLAAAYSASGDDQKALQAALRAVALDPKDADTSALIGGTYLRMGDHAKAEPYAVRALQLQPGLSSAQVVLAKIYLAQRQPRKALPELQSAAKDDTDGTVYYLLATTFRQLDRQAEAATAMQKYKQLHSAHVAAAAAPQ
jgi:tetratricopeptide (TPR) repeat protein